jgi:DNA-binding transcriptional LysR family regulator
MRRKNLPLNALRAFEAAARLGRLTVAAEELGVTHGAVSRQVRQLESVLGVDLFGGPRSKPELTPTGQSLAPVLTAALDQIDNAVRAVLAEEEGLLQVACLSTLAMRWLIPRLHRFTQVHPGIDVRLSTDKEHIDPERGRFDLVITVIDGEEVLRARDALLFREQIGVVLLPALMPSAKQLRTSGLSSIPRLATRTRPNAWATWDALGRRQWMRRSSLPLNSSTTISQSEPRLAGLEHASCRGISWPTKSLEVVLSPPLGLGRQAIGTSYAARDLLIESRHVSQHG